MLLIMVGMLIGAGCPETEEQLQEENTTRIRFTPLTNLTNSKGETHYRCGAECQNCGRKPFIYIPIGIKSSLYIEKTRCPRCGRKDLFCR